jgi:hypothetical protein
MANQASDVRSGRPASRTCWPARSLNLLDVKLVEQQHAKRPGRALQERHSIALSSAKMVTRLDLCPVFRGN